MLGGKTTDWMHTYGKGQVFVGCSFAPNGGTSPVAASNKGSLLKSVVWTSTGTWTITLAIPTKDIVAIVPGAQINSAANVDTSLEIGAVTPAGTGTTIVVRNNPGGAVADIAAAASNRINLMILVQAGAVK